MLLHYRHTSFSQNPCSLGAAQTVEEIAGNESVAGKAEKSRATTKATSTVLRGSCTDSDGDSKHILDTDRVSCIRKKWHVAVKLREGRSTKYDVCHFLFVLL